MMDMRRARKNPRLNILIIMRQISQAFELEHFPIKWLPVDRRKCDKNKKIERPT